MEQHALKLVARAALTDAVLVAIVAALAKTASDPEAWVREFSDRIRNPVEKKNKASPDEPEKTLAYLVVTNELDDFVHRVLAEVRRRRS